MRILLSFFSLLIFVPACAAQSIPPNPSADVQHYTFRLTLSDETDEIIGETSVKVQFGAGTQTFGLDLIGKTATGTTGMVVSSITENNQPVSFTHQADKIHIQLAQPAQHAEQHTYQITYQGVPADGLIISKNKYGERTFFGDNWPNRARHWLPAVDHPSDKATCAFIVIAPESYQVVGSGALVEETSLDDNLRLTHWATSVSLSTKVMVIGVARFAVQYVDEFAGVPIESWVYPQDREAGFHDFARAENILQYFVSHIGPFPYEKLANVQSKTRFGGMENASNIFYSERSITGTRSNEGLLAHEIAHQWFGDSVTESDWPHIWLSEGFASYFTQLYMENTYGRDRMNAGLANARRSVLAYARQNPKATVVNPNVTELMRLLNAYSYQKGAWVLHMLRFVVGDEVFWDGIRAYYRQFRDQNASSLDFQHIMESVAGQDLTWFFQEWLHQPGQPKLEGTWSYNATTQQLIVTLNQVQESGVVFQMPLELGIYTGHNTVPALHRVTLDQPTHTFTISLDTAPTHVKLDPNQWILMEGSLSPN